MARGFVAVPLALMELPLGSAQAPLPGPRIISAAFDHAGSRLDALRAPRTVSSVEPSADPETSGSRTEVRSTLRWREQDSNRRSRSCERLFRALLIGGGGTKVGAP